MSKGHRNIIPALPAIILIIALYISGLMAPLNEVAHDDAIFFEAMFGISSLYRVNVLSAILAFIFLALTSFVMVSIARRFSSGYTHLIPIIYPIMVISNPYSLYFNPVHIEALLLSISFLYYFAFIAIEQNASHLFVSNFMLVIASCFFPPLIWMAPLMCITGINLADDKFKYLVSYILSTVMPMLLLLALSYLILDNSIILETFPTIFPRMTDVSVFSFNFALVTLTKIFTISLISFIAIVDIVKNSQRYKISKHHVYLRLVLFTIALFLLCLIFASNCAAPGIALVGIPVSLMINELFNVEHSHSNINILIAITALLIITERFTYFV